MTSLKFSNPDSIAEFQESSLKQLLLYLNNHSPFYSSLFREHNIDISQIKTIKDLVAIPVVTKDDLQKRNIDFLCVDQKYN